MILEIDKKKVLKFQDNLKILKNSKSHFKIFCKCLTTIYSLQTSDFEKGGKIATNCQLYEFCRLQIIDAFL